MDTFIAVIVLLLLVGLAVLYIIRAKKSGKRCIGCPDSGQCTGSCGCCLGGCDNVKNDPSTSALK